MSVLQAAAVFSLSYHLAPPPVQPQHARASTPSMEYRLNNYVLPGPMTPMGNQALIRLRRVNDQTTGGLFVPTAETEKPKEGVVIAAGKGLPHPQTGEMLDCPVKEGDMVLLADFSGESVDYNGEKHIFCDAANLLGVFEGGAIAADKFRPLGDRVMVAVAEQATETTTGIALAGMEDEESNMGEVVAVGEGRLAPSGEAVPVDIAPGSSVMYARYTAAEATVDGKKYKIVSEADCLAKW